MGEIAARRCQMEFDSEVRYSMQDLHILTYLRKLAGSFHEIQMMTPATLKLECSSDRFVQSRLKLIAADQKTLEAKNDSAFAQLVSRTFRSKTDPGASYHPQIPFTNLCTSLPKGHLPRHCPHILAWFRLTFFATQTAHIKLGLSHFDEQIVIAALHFGRQALQFAGTSLQTGSTRFAAFSSIVLSTCAREKSGSGVGEVVVRERMVKRRVGRMTVFMMVKCWLRVVELFVRTLAIGVSRYRTD